MSAEENTPLVTSLRGQLTEYVARVEDLERQLHAAKMMRAQEWPVIATQRLRSVVSALGLQSEVPEGDLTGHEFAVLGVIRRAVDRLQAEQGVMPVKLTLVDLVLQWACDRKIIPNAKPYVQLMKTGSELGELFDAEIKGDRAGIIDGVGDVLVTLIIYSELHGLTIDECLAAAYDEIKDRRGTLLPNGVFVKEST